MKSLSSVVFATLLALPASATVTLTFSDFSSALTGLSDSTGAAPVNGLEWGILIDTEQDGIPEAGGFPALVGSLGLNLADGVDLGNNDLFYFGNTTVTIPGPNGGSGGVSSAIGIDPYAGSGVSENDPFYIVWWDTGITDGSELAPGTNYGLIEDSSLLLPSDGSDVSYSSLFSGADPTRAASLTLVPEPSAALLCLVSSLALLRRRR